MLVLSRRKNEEILLPDLQLTITVIKVKGKAVSLGVSAPRDVRIIRGELSPFEPEEEPEQHANQLMAATA
jgi:carbon storage regulator CsrA